MSKIYLFLMIVGFSGCGYEKAEHVEYKKPNANKAIVEKDSAIRSDVEVDSASKQAKGSEKEELSCEDKAIGLFEDQIQTAVTQVCASCHSAGGQGSAAIQFSAGDVDLNIAAFTDYISGDPDKLIAKLGPAGGHGGGVQIGNGITADGIGSWYEAASGCP